MEVGTAWVEDQINAHRRNKLGQRERPVVLDTWKAEAEGS